MAAAGIALRPLLLGPDRAARVIASLPEAMYLQVDDAGSGGAGSGGAGSAGPVDVVALLGANAVRLPIGVLLDSGVPAASWGVGERARVGEGRVSLGGRSWRVLRWWDSRVPTGPTRHSALDPTPATSGAAWVARLVTEVPADVASAARRAWCRPCRPGRPPVADRARWPAGGPRSRLHPGRGRRAVRGHGCAGGAGAGGRRCRRGAHQGSLRRARRASAGRPLSPVPCCAVPPTVMPCRR